VDSAVDAISLLVLFYSSCQEFHRRDRRHLIHQAPVADGGGRFNRVRKGKGQLMIRPLRSHIAFLEEKIQSLRGQLAGANLTVEDVEDIELQLSLPQSALDYYRRAYELELKVAGNGPSAGPSGTKPEGWAKTGRHGAGKCDGPKTASHLIEPKRRRAKSRRVRDVAARRAVVKAEASAGSGRSRR